MTDANFVPIAINPQCTQIAIYNKSDKDLVVLSTENKRLIFKRTLHNENDGNEIPILSFLNETSLLPLTADLESLELYNMLKDKLILKIKMTTSANITDILSHVDLERLLLVLDNGLVVIYDLLDGLKILDTVDIFKSFDDYQLFSDTKSTTGSIQMNRGGQVVPVELLNKRKHFEPAERLPESFKSKLINFYKNNSNGNICVVFQNERLVYTSLVKEEFEVIEDYNKNKAVDELHTGDVIDTTKQASSRRKMLEPVDKPKLVLKNVIVYNTSTLKFEKILKNLHNSGIETMCLSEDGKILVTCSTKGTIIRCFKLDDLVSKTTAKPFAEFRRGSTFAKIEKLVIDSNNEFIAALVANSEIIHIFNLKDYQSNIDELRDSSGSKFNKYFKKFTKRDHIRHCCYVKRDYNSRHEFQQCILQFERINKKFDPHLEEDLDTSIPNLFILYQDSMKTYTLNLNGWECSLALNSPQISSFSL